MVRPRFTARFRSRVAVKFRPRFTARFRSRFTVLLRLTTTLLRARTLALAEPFRSRDARTRAFLFAAVVELVRGATLYVLCRDGAVETWLCGLITPVLLTALRFVVVD